MINALQCIWIQGNKFKSIAKWHYAPARIFTGNKYRDDINNLPYTDYRYLKNTLDFAQLKSDDIIYTHTFYADQLFEKLEKIENTQLTVITHNSDTTVDFVPPDNVYWFTTNVNIRYKSIRSIPIGLENDFWLKDKKEKMIKKLSQHRNYKAMVYVNHNVKTNPERQKPYDLLKGKKWATVNSGANGQGFDNYLDNIFNHPFVVCPSGNGIDTHRTWECLYMGTIPIEKRNINNQFYTDLPILFVDDWEEITERFLHDEFMRIKDTKWNLEKLNFEYWQNEIIGNSSIL
jgi:hypothetical protein